MRTNAVFSGFSATLEPATIFMNPITFVMNYLYFLFRHLRRHSLNRTPSYTFSFSHGSNHGWTLGGGRSILLSYGRIWNFYRLHRRLGNTLGSLRRAPLYPLSYRDNLWFLAYTLGFQPLGQITESMVTVIFLTGNQHKDNTFLTPLYPAEL